MNAVAAVGRCAPTDRQDEMSASELALLAATDSTLYCQAYFPKTFRQPPAPFHPLIWSTLENPANRYCNIQVHRDGAKTTTLRAFTSRRVAYSISRTILYIGKSEQHAIRSLDWIRRQVEYNTPWARTFGLRPGKKWGGPEAEIYHGVDEVPIWILAMGITGSVRGINRDDYRPDLIIIDDVIDEENAATPEQRQKMNNLIHGALKESLAPSSECPTATIAMLQTPLDPEDASMLAFKDPEWASLRLPCWTLETERLPLEKQVSSWPARYPTADLRKQKAAAIAANRYYIFSREKELRLVSPETASFGRFKIQTYELEPERHEMQVVMWIDPVPPPSEQQVAKGFAKKDYEAFAVVGRHREKFFLLDYRLNRGHEPDWTIATFFELGMRWRPRTVYVESTAYQRTLAFLLRQAMSHRRLYFAINEVDERRKKMDRILDGLTGPASEGKLYVRSTHSDFIAQFETYPACSHDDLIEAVAGCVEKLNFEFVIEGEAEEEGTEMPRRPEKRLEWRHAP